MPTALTPIEIENIRKLLNLTAVVNKVPAGLLVGVISKSSVGHFSIDNDPIKSRKLNAGEISRLQSAIKDYSATDPDYKIGDLVKESNKVYRNITAITVAEVFTVAKWELLADISPARTVTVTMINKTGFTIPQARAVRIEGHDATSDKTTVAPALADTTANAQVIGLTVNEILDDAEGEIIISGQLDKLDTSARTAGVQLFLSATLPGVLVPIAPGIVCLIGNVGSSDVSTGFISLQIEPPGIGAAALSGAVFTGTVETPGLTLTTNDVKWTVTRNIIANPIPAQGTPQLTSTLNVIDTIAADNDSVTLQSAEEGILRTTVVNAHPTKTLQIFPASGDDLGRGQNISILLPPGNSIVFSSPEDTKWIPISRRDVSCKVTKSANQSLVKNILTVITWNQEKYDTDGMHDNAINNTRITFNTPGKYYVNCQAEFGSNSQGERRLQIRKNGTTIIGATRYTSSGESEHTFSDIFDFAEDDYVELFALQGSNGNLDFVAGTIVENTFFATQLLS